MLEVLYEDNHIIVVVKPHNVPSQKDSSNDIDLLTMVKQYIKQKYDKPGNVYVGLVHRLDRPTGGVMVFAKTSKAASRLSQQIRDKVMEKRYFAAVGGSVKNNRDHLTHYLKKNVKNNTVSVVGQTVTDAKIAELDYKVLERIDKATLVEVELNTGRSHQIRVQLKHIGHPIVSDVKYGSDIGKGRNLALWAYQLRFEHPTTKVFHTFKVLPPLEDFPWKYFKYFDKI